MVMVFAFHSNYEAQSPLSRSLKIKMTSVCTGSVIELSQTFSSVAVIHGNYFTKIGRLSSSKLTWKKSNGKCCCSNY